MKKGSEIEKNVACEWVDIVSKLGSAAGTERGSEKKNKPWFQKGATIEKIARNGKITLQKK